MRRKIFNDFANVLCQKFVDLPNGYDLATLAKLGSGVVSINILTDQCFFEESPIEPLRTCAEHRQWLQIQLAKRQLSLAVFESISMSVEFRVTDTILDKPYGHDFRHADFWLKCTSEIRTPEAKYNGSSERQKKWGYGNYWQDLYGE